MSLAGPTHSRIARHGTDSIEIDSQHQGAQTHARRSVSRLAASVTAANYHNVEIHTVHRQPSYQNLLKNP
ncbi:MAG: hypothetical protein BWY75_03831 [bacterium ADurb.Bin425]|nr:MAG: hypothetical protein BWY75_03831 [bacterium ADurb.Bin425]